MVKDAFNTSMPYYKSCSFLVELLIEKINKLMEEENV